MLKGKFIVKQGVECPNCGYLNQERKEHYGECENCKTEYEQPTGNKSKLNDGVMPADCEWQTDVGYFGCDYYYSTGCGEAYYLTDGTPEQNSYSYCPNCGGKIKQA